MDQVSFTGVQYTDVSPLTPDQGTHIWALGVLMTLKLAGQQTGGLFSTFDGEFVPGAGPPAHYHTREDETWYLLEGEMTWTVGLEKKKYVATKGTMIFLPRGTPHTFSNESGKKARMLVTFSPAGLEKWFFEVGIPVDDPANPVPPPPLRPEAVAKALQSGTGNYGMVFIPPDERPLREANEEL